MITTHGTSYCCKDDTITTFDTLYTTNSIQLIKLMLPLFHPSARPLLATIVKALELSFCYDQLKHCDLNSLSIIEGQIDQYIKEAQKYCSSEQLQFFQTLSQMRNMMKVMNKIDLFSSNTPFTQESILQSYMSKEQQTLYQKYMKQFSE